MNSHVLDARKSLSTVADFAAEGPLASVRSVMIDELVAGAEAAFEARASGPGAVVRFSCISSKAVNKSGREKGAYLSKCDLLCSTNADIRECSSLQIRSSGTFL